ncbi:MAG: class I adenylate-forming enzyme family protein [Syntrophobacteraceae bacterium]|nr:class I adenylate-forming enzyme family protein [Syntrophobacteraceae bacterium]
MAHWMNLGQNFKVNAKKFAEKVAFKEGRRSFTYAQTNERVNRLAHSLLSLGLKKGEKIAVLLENSIEIVELYLATAKTGLVIVPVNFRLIGPDVEYIVNDSDSKALFVHAQFSATIDSIRGGLANVPQKHYFVVGDPTAGFTDYETFLQGGNPAEPECEVAPEDIWVLIYTSGTTGKPKGVLRSHESHVAYYLVNALEFGFTKDDVCMNVMPLCHINSVYFTFTFTYLGATAYIHPAMSFRGEEVLEIIEREKITFISLIPTHYSLILAVGEEGRKRDVGSIRKLLCSSAPVRQKMKTDIMEFFPGVELYEAYGSTEGGMVTILKPGDQLRKLGSIGLEVLGTDSIRLLDAEGAEVGGGEVGEIFSSGPMLFTGYYKAPEKTARAFRGSYFSAGDMGRKDADGYYQIVDRKDNMIITGGEHVYPSEVEEVVGSHEYVFDCACIGAPDEKWGEKVVVMVIAKEGAFPEKISADIISQHCKDKLAAYKRPKEVIFIGQEEMPRTGTGKILHRELRRKFTG